MVTHSFASRPASFVDSPDSARVANEKLQLALELFAREEFAPKMWLAFSSGCVFLK